MEAAIGIIDQTLNEALRLGIETSNINLIIKDLQRYPVEFIDIYMKYLKENYADSNYNFQNNLMRCVVSTSIEEINSAKRMRFSKVVVAWYHQSKSLDLSKLYYALNEVKSFAEEVYLCIENAADYSLDEIEIYYPIILKYGIIRLIYKDKNTAIDCFITYEKLNRLREKAPFPVEFIGNNTYGLATANSLAAFKAGINYIGTSIGGVGLCGNAAMEEVLMSLKHLWNKKQIPDGITLAFDCAEILSYMEIKLPVDKAIIGKSVFAHESGIHVDGISKNPSLYEIIKPEEVGLTRQLVIGKHSGVASIKYKFLQWNVYLNQAEAKQLLEKVKEIAIEQKSPLSDYQLKQLYKG